MKCARTYVGSFHCEVSAALALAQLDKMMLTVIAQVAGLRPCAWAISLLGPCALRCAWQCRKYHRAGLTEEKTDLTNSSITDSHVQPDQSQHVDT